MYAIRSYYAGGGRPFLLLNRGHRLRGARNQEIAIGGQVSLAGRKGQKDIPRNDRPVMRIARMHEKHSAGNARSAIAHRTAIGPDRNNFV